MDTTLPFLSGDGPPEKGPDGLGGPGFPGDRLVAGYYITGRLGQGGMGVVWDAIQLSTKRPVALKLMSNAAFGSEHRRTAIRSRDRIDRQA